MDHLIKEKSKVGFGIWSRVAINIRSSSKAMTRSMESGRGYRLLDEDDVYQLVQKLYSLLQSGNDLRVVSHTLLDFNMDLVAKGEFGTRDAKYSSGLSAKAAAEGERQIELECELSIRQECVGRRDNEGSLVCSRLEKRHGLLSVAKSQPFRKLCLISCRSLDIFDLFKGLLRVFITA
jgi:hypothetical protein